MPGLSLSRSLVQQKSRRLAAVANLPLQQPKLAMPQTQQLQKIILVEKVPGSLTAHLMPLVTFIKEQGNTPSAALSYAQQNPDGFNFDRDGLGNFIFEQPLDVAAIQAHFDFPSTIGFTPQGDIWDSRNRVGIIRSRPVSEEDAAYDWE